MTIKITLFYLILCLMLTTALSIAEAAPAMPAAVEQVPPSDVLALSASKMLQKLSPLPKCQKSRARKRVAEAAEVLTSSPYKKKLLDKSSKKPNAKQEAVKVGVRQKDKKCSKLKTKKKTCREDKRRGRKPGEAVKVGVRQKDKKCSKIKTKKTCREDKRRGRKPGKVKAPKPKSKPKTKKTKESNADTADYYCVICGEIYVDPPTETWLQCQSCAGWCHEACTDGEGSQGFICDLCQ